MSVSCDGVADVYTLIWRKARKGHECCACRQTIQKGHSYSLSTYIYEGLVSRYKRCARCEAIHKHLRELFVEKGWDRDGEWPDDALNCGHTYKNPPPEIEALAFALPGEITP